MAQTYHLARLGRGLFVRRRSTQLFESVFGEASKLRRTVRAVTEFFELQKTTVKFALSLRSQWLFRLAIGKLRENAQCREGEIIDSVAAT
jgi:hypothetical protein